MSMAYVPIPKDLQKVKTKVAFNLTKRQLIGFSLAGGVGIPTYLLLRNAVPTDIAMIGLIVVALPFFFITLYEKDGQTFEQYFKYVYLHEFYQPKERVRKEALREKNTRTAGAKAQGKPKSPAKK